GDRAIARNLKWLKARGFSLEEVEHDLSPHQRGELHKTDLGSRLQLDLFIERFSLVLIDENEKAVTVECFAGELELFFPVDVAVFLELKAVEGLLRAGWLHQAAEVLGGFAVVVLHLLVDPAADQLAHGDFFGEDVELQL